MQVPIAQLSMLIAVLQLECMAGHACTLLGYYTYYTYCCMHCIVAINMLRFHRFIWVTIHQGPSMIRLHIV